MSLSYVKGDLFESGQPAIAHGVNCRGVMGSGIAVGFRSRYPEMYELYKSLCKDGTLQLGGVFGWQKERACDEAPAWVGLGVGPIIYNLATQCDPGPNAKYSGVMIAMDAMLGELSRLGIPSVGIPLIGCGIGGLDLDHVKGIWLALAEKYPTVDIVVYTI